ncbi:transketolase [Geothrix limicola]|uniref:Transketolase n=1 Tax=Geothrix limicola TaxID=2927978 RepID=A0ABQ5QG50_9BACT|nr:transketolase [Geothrix limicola]GLH73416.1 transketolase [Geothrix limicola]
MDRTNDSAPAVGPLEQLAINTIRFLSVDAIQMANSGHPGLPLGAAPMAYTLWTRFLRHNPADPSWFNRDRFVLSAGHGSMLLYSLLHLTGYDLPLEQFHHFRQWGSRMPGHPERGLTPGVEVTTGPLGQGFGNGVGLAMAEAHLAARYNRPGFDLINHLTYGLVSDGDLMEGVAAESASLAGHLKLGKLIYLYDDNRVTLAASTQLTFTENLALRFESYGWHVETVADGNDVEAIARAIAAAQGETTRPSLIQVRTHLGYGSPHKQDTFTAHGSPLGVEEVALTKQNLGWPLEPSFHVPADVERHFREAVERGRMDEAEWKATFARYEAQYPELGRELRQLIQSERPHGWDSGLPSFPADAKGMATRVASGAALQVLAAALPGLIGGSADLNPSTETELKGMGNFQSPIREVGDLQGSAGGGWNQAGRNLAFGVREHAMGAVLNGLAAHGGLLPFGATFLTFSDYLRPAIRLAALMELQVIYVFTHDSIGMGEDGPTHQPVEHLASLRAIPGLIVIRPGDANETAVAWRVAVESNHRPVALVLTRQNVPTLDRHRFASAEGLRRGAYVLADPPKDAPRLILLASGSEIGLIVAAAEELQAKQIPVRLVSMPSWELFEAQPQAYRDAVLPPSIQARLAVEAGVSQGWHRYIGSRGDVIAVDHFGASAPGPTLLREYGFSPEHVCQRALALLDEKGT